MKIECPNFKGINLIIRNQSRGKIKKIRFYACQEHD